MLTIPQLDFLTYASQVFWLVVCMAVLYIFLSKFYVPRVKSILSERALYIESNTSGAESAEVLVRTMSEKQASKLTEARREAGYIVKDALARAEERRLAGRMEVVERNAKAVFEADENVAKAVHDQCSEIKIALDTVVRELYKSTIGYYPDISDEELRILVAESCKRKGVLWE